MKSFVGTVLFFVAYPLIFIAVRGSKRARVLVIAENHVLLIKEFIEKGDRWTLIGGGSKGSESLKDCAARELKEEVGIVVDPRKLRSLGESERRSMGISYTACLYSITLDSKRDVKKSLEIRDAKWFPLNKLPQSRKPLVDYTISRNKQG